MRRLIVNDNISQATGDKLLQILRKRLLPDLPKTCRSFLNTERCKYQIVQMEDADGTQGEFVYLGIEAQLKMISSVKIDESCLIELTINIDGFKPFNSTNQTLWPILAKVDLKSEPFVIAIYSGVGHPKYPCQFLADFITEINVLQVQGSSDLGKKVFVKCFICDTPVRAWLKCCQGHTSSRGCERCYVIGESIDRVMCFSSLGHSKMSSTIMIPVHSY